MPQADGVAANMRSKAENLLMSFNGDWTEDTLNIAMADRAPQCQHIMLPASLGIAPKNNEQWARHLKEMIGSVKDGKMSLHDTIVDVDARKVACRSSMTATTPYDPYQNEYMRVFTFDASGAKIVEIVEMFDSAVIKEIRDRGAKAAEERKQ